MTTYRIRPAVAALSCATVPLLVVAAWALLGLAVDSPPTIAVGVLLGLALFVRNLVRVRRRSLTVSDDGLVVQRDSYRLVVPWAGIRGVRRRTHQLVMRAEELVVTGAQVEAVDPRGRPQDVGSQLDGHPATTRVMISFYDRHWREGPVGRRLRDSGILD